MLKKHKPRVPLKITGLKFLYLLATILISTNAIALSIQHVSHVPVKSSYKAGETITVRFLLDEAANVSLKIYDDREYLVRTINSNTLLKQGEQEMHWDGKDETGKLVPNEAYHYTLEADNGKEKVVHDVTDLTGNDKGILLNLKWDRKEGTISYTLTRSSRVNFRVGIASGGPLLRTVINWLPRTRGQHVEFWDGYDEDKKFNIAKIPRAELFSDAYSLSKNAIIIDPKIELSKYVEINEPVQRQRNKENNRLDNKSRVAQDRADYPLAIRLPLSEKQKNGVPVYSGKVAVKINVPRSELERLSRDRFEPILFVDGQFASELETGFFPVTWQLDTEKLEAGEHTITVNIRGYNGQYGTATQIIYVEKQ